MATSQRTSDYLYTGNNNGCIKYGCYSSRNNNIALATTTTTTTIDEHVIACGIVCA
jgi:hypothetical protein